MRDGVCQLICQGAHPAEVKELCRRVNTPYVAPLTFTLPCCLQVVHVHCLVTWLNIAKNIDCVQCKRPINPYDISAITKKRYEDLKLSLEVALSGVNNLVSFSQEHARDDSNVFGEKLRFSRGAKRALKSMDEMKEARRDLITKFNKHKTEVRSHLEKALVTAREIAELNYDIRIDTQQATIPDSIKLLLEQVQPKPAPRAPARRRGT
jgi:hypothetical protein